MLKRDRSDVTLGVDGRCFVGPAAGTTRYACELASALQDAFNVQRVLVYGPVNMELPRLRGWHARAEHQPIWRRLPTTLWYRWRAGKLAQRDGVSIFLAGANFLPVFRGQRLKSTRDTNRAVSILVVYDLVADLFPQTMTWPHRIAHRLFLKSSIERCDLLVVISHGTASRMKACYGRRPDLILHPPIDRRFQPQGIEIITKLKQAYRLPERYILAVGTIEPRKNLGALIQACERLTEEGHDFGALVIAGSQGWLAQATNVEIARAQASGLDIRLLGHVAEADLPALYAGAQLFVLPSLYEGFGMPVAEALHCGTRVLATDMPETREAGGAEAFYCPPTVDGLRSGILQALAAPSAAHPDFYKPEQTRKASDQAWAAGVAKLADLLRVRA